MHFQLLNLYRIQIRLNFFGEGGVDSFIRKISFANWMKISIHPVLVLEVDFSLTVDHCGS